MAKFGVVVFIILLGALVAAGLYFAYGNFPARSTHVEKVVPNARFAK